MNEEKLNELLRSALPPESVQGPSRDLWPAILQRIESPTVWTWLDACLLASITIGMLIFPRMLVLMALNL